MTSFITIAIILVLFVVAIRFALKDSDLVKPTGPAYKSVDPKSTASYLQGTGSLQGTKTAGPGTDTTTRVAAPKKKAAKKAAKKVVVTTEATV
jgi:hypothetical protein